MYVYIIQCSSISCANLQDKMNASIIDINKQHTNKIAQLTNELKENQHVDTLLVQCFQK